MLQNEIDRDYANVFGLTYKEAEGVMQRIEYVVKDRKNKGFATKEFCEQFAKENHLDIIVHMKSGGTFRAVTHRGDAILPSEWRRMYRQILFYSYEQDGEMKQAFWSAEDYDHFSSAKVFGEMSDGKSKPLYTRNYFLPTGFFVEEKEAFNSAKPITSFAKETGADTSHIHELLRRLSGECYPYLLSWLKAKMVNPTRKTEVIPIFTGGQGTGKSTFGEVICRALFGEENILVTDQFDSSARFNADQADALVVCIEEKTQDDKKNTSGALKSKATARQTRKENKGVDPFYQESYTDYVMSTNEYVPLKFEGRGNQRRFMVMECDGTFTRERNPLAEEVFTRLYGYNINGEKVTKGLLEDKDTIAQFKYELWRDGDKVNYRKFPHTAAYDRCFDIPRTNESIDIEIILKALLPFVKASLMMGSRQDKITMTSEDEEPQDIYLDTIIMDTNAFQYVRKSKQMGDRIALCRYLIFMDSANNRPYAHSVVERMLLDMKVWIKETFGLVLLNDTNYPSGGFKNVTSKARFSPTAWFTLPDDDIDEETSYEANEVFHNAGSTGVPGWPGREGQRVGFNGNFVYDENGEYETLNELKPNCIDRRQENAQYMDTFLLEADDTTEAIKNTELRRFAIAKQFPLNAETFYKERLTIQDTEATRLFDLGIACRIVYSGAKSLHILIRVADSPNNMEERVWLDAYLKSTLSNVLTFDASTKDPTRLTRSPRTLERETICPYDETKQAKLIGTQRLLAVNWNNIYDIRWRQIYEAWKSQPPSRYEERGKMMPSKQIYKDAVQDILDGVFFTDYKWTGKRQDAFFPAYRLLREMGYTHDELWQELHKQIEDYKKRGERSYWHTREHSTIIKQIDKEFEDAEE